MLVLGYLFGMRSERGLCGEVDLNLAYRWFCRLGLDGRVSDQSTFTKNRHGRFPDSRLMRTVFERVLAECFATGLASSKHVAVDGSFIRADANYARRIADANALRHERASLAVREYLAGLDLAAPDTEGVSRSKPKSVSLTDPARHSASRTALRPSPTA